MAKQKIHELAKELEVPSKIIVDYMNKKQKQSLRTRSLAMEKAARQNPPTGNLCQKKAPQGLRKKPVLRQSSMPSTANRATGNHVAREPVNAGREIILSVRRKNHIFRSVRMRTVQTTTGRLPMYRMMKW